MNSNDICQVKNRSASFVVYSIPEDNIRREFNPGEIKRIPFTELEKLSFQQGGREIMSSFLQIAAQEATDNLGIHRELEYDMSEEQIIDLIVNGSLDAFLDALDFAPIGVIDLIKRFAIEIPMNDLNKRNALKEKTGFDATTALSNLLKVQEEERDGSESNNTTGRRVKPVEKKQERRTTPQYKVVTPKS